MKLRDKINPVEWVKDLKNTNQPKGKNKTVRGCWLSGLMEHQTRRNLDGARLLCIECRCINGAETDCGERKTMLRIKRRARHCHSVRVSLSLSALYFSQPLRCSFGRYIDRVRRMFQIKAGIVRVGRIISGWCTLDKSISRSPLLIGFRRYTTP